MFSTNLPVMATGFYDRERELDMLGGMVDRVASGTPQWIALVGVRKVGKTSLLLEAERRSAARGVIFVVTDVMASEPVSDDFFRRYALTVVDRLIGRDIGVSLEALASNGNEYRAALAGATRFGKLPASLRRMLLDLPEAKAQPELRRFCLDLPETLAHALDVRVLVAIDEFQELANLGRAGANPYPVMRSIWQKHQRVGYVISGSARSLMLDLVTSKRSPFFQHFSLVEVGGFARADALRLLVGNGPPERSIDVQLGHRIIDVVGGHPFYLQLIGESLTALEPPYDEATLKDAVQGLLFSRTGRLSLYFENEYARVVGRSTALAAALEALAGGELRLTDVAAAIGAPTGATMRYLERLGDAIARDAKKRYSLVDPVFGLWLKWRSPGGTVVPMGILGDDAEKATADALARMGFDLVYQSRASRGAFDLLATRGATQLGVQVKRTPLPVRFQKAAWARMEAESKRFGWRWTIAAVDPASSQVTFLDPTKAARAREIRLAPDAVITNVLTWLDRPQKRAARSDT